MRNATRVEPTFDPANGRTTTPLPAPPAFVDSIDQLPERNAAASAAVPAPGMVNRPPPAWLIVPGSKRVRNDGVSGVPPTTAVTTDVAVVRPAPLLATTCTRSRPPMLA